MICKECGKNDFEFRTIVNSFVSSGIFTYNTQRSHFLWGF